VKTPVHAKPDTTEALAKRLGAVNDVLASAGTTGKPRN
jgi:hypothetical protein